MVFRRLGLHSYSGLEIYAYKYSALIVQKMHTQQIKGHHEIIRLNKTFVLGTIKQYHNAHKTNGKAVLRKDVEKH